MSRPRKIIIDCDAGTDDAQAIMMAIAQTDIDIIAITTLYGNATVENVSKNVLRILKYKGRLDIPVYQGCGRSMLGVPSPADGFHGSDGLGDIFIESVDPVDDKDLQKEHAVQALVRLVNESPGQVTLVATGPLTNVAMALQLDPDFGTKLKDIVVMGGNSEGKGNMTPAAEFNFFCDPEAVYFVFGQAKRKVTLAALEMCEEHAFSWDWYNSFTSDETKTGALIRRFEKVMVDRVKREGGTNYFMIWDQVAMAIAINNQVAMETKDVYATVELQGKATRGQVIIDWRNQLKHEANICLVSKLNKALLTTLMNSIIKS